MAHAQAMHRISRPFSFDHAALSTRGSLPTARAVSSTALEGICSRRVLILSSGVTGGVLVGAERSWALLPDDADTELISKAKARRKKRLQEELASEKKFVRDEGFRSNEKTKLETSVQTAVYNLAVSGSMIESGALGKVSDLMKADWVTEFNAAATELSSGISGAQDNAQEILTGISSLQSTAANGDLDASKKEFVAVVSSFQNWTSLVGLQSSLKGL